MKPAVYSTDKSKRYPYVLTEDLVAPLSYHWAKGRYEFWFEDRLLAVIENYKITIFKGYACNGATLAPNIAEGMAAFFVHDLLYQFGRCAHCPWNRGEADIAMYHLMVRAQVDVAMIYYCGVKSMGWAFYRAHFKAFIYKAKT